MSNRNASFGPRGAGSRAPKMARESGKLEREASAMEARLKALRDDVDKSRAEREAGGSSGAPGGWRSARTDRGGLKSYATDARRQPKAAASRRPQQQQQQQQQQKASRAARPQQQQQQQQQGGGGGGGGAAAVARWDVAAVGAWLGRVGLGKYAEVFASNEIAGEVLLELGLDDMDYMEVKALAHRKALMKGVAELKRGGDGLSSKVTKKPSASSSSSSSSSTASQENTGRTIAPQAAAGKHWSHVAPLSENTVAGGEGLHDNLADGAFDEAGGKAAFAEALAEWRTGSGRNPGKVQIVTSDGLGDGAVQVHEEAAADVGGGGGMWSNPAAPAATATASAQSEGAGGGGGGGSGGSGGALLTGPMVDEAKEQEDFKAAVAAWRTGKPGPAKPKGGAGAGAGAGAGTHEAGAGDDSSTATDEKACCWLTYETFAKASGHFDKASGKWFKNAANAAIFGEKAALEEAQRSKRRADITSQLRAAEAKADAAADDDEDGDAGAKAARRDDDDDDDDDDDFDPSQYDAGRGTAAEPKQTPRSAVVVTELPPADGKAGDDDDGGGGGGAKASYVVEEASDDDDGGGSGGGGGGEQVEWGADAKQEVTVAQYSEIVNMDVKF